MHMHNARIAAARTRLRNLLQAEASGGAARSSHAKAEYSADEFDDLVEKWVWWDGWEVEAHSAVGACTHFLLLQLRHLTTDICCWLLPADCGCFRHQLLN